MKLLLDTQIFIWWADQPEKLSLTMLSALEDEANDLILSVASVWEMQIKVQVGKLKLNLPLKELIANQQTTNGLTVSPVTLSHVLKLDALPFSQRSIRSVVNCSINRGRLHSGQCGLAVLKLFG
jgi:PIN domain nuclease of toxin-antitoxin system